MICQSGLQGSIDINGAPDDFVVIREESISTWWQTALRKIGLNVLHDFKRRYSLAHEVY